MIAAVLLGLTLVLLSRRREFLSAKLDIKNPFEWTEEDARQARAQLSELYAKMEEYVKQQGGLSEQEVTNRADFAVGMMLAQVWTALYKPSTSRLTTGDVEAILGTDSPPADVLPIIRTALNKYFQTEEGPARNPIDMPPQQQQSQPPISRPSTSTGVSPSQPQVQGSDITSIVSLEEQYQKLKSDYEAVVNKALITTGKNELMPLVDRILELNSQMTTVLEQLVSKLALAEANGNTNFSAKRNDFALRLSQIKKDYGDLKSDTDKLTTLRRIREYEEQKATSGLKGYLLAFAVAVSLLILVIFMKMFQPKNVLYATNPTTPSPAISPTLNM